MPFLLIVLLAVTVAPHRDWSLIPKRCESCHVGHGVKGEKLLPERGEALCLRCHAGRGQASQAVLEGYLAPHANPPDMSQLLTLPYQHSDPGGCIVCHAGHGVVVDPYEPLKSPKASTKHRNEYEHQLCQPCHESNPLYREPRSFHPVVARPDPVHGGTAAQPQGKWVACSDCHGTNVMGLPKGVHGSQVSRLLSAFYETEDGLEESAQRYALCYVCHERESILGDAGFSLHSVHVIQAKTSCYTCHDSHAGLVLPFLLTFEDESRNARVFPDGSGRKTYESTGDRAGVCYLTCHNVEHDGWAYGPEGKELKRSMKGGAMRSLGGIRRGPAGFQPKK